MSTALLFVAFGVIAAIAIGMAVIAGIQARKRRDEFATYAVAKGWIHVPRDDRWCYEFEGHPFGEGHDRRASNVLTGVYDGRPALAFDYLFHTTETSTNQQGHTTRREVRHPYAVVAVDTGVLFPTLRVTPEGFFDRVVGKLLNKDILLESEDFNRAFTVTCPDRKFASDVLHPRMMERVLASRHVGWGFNGKWILTFEDGNHSLLEIDQRFAALDGVLDDIPEFIWREVRGPST